ncbi:MAG: response regulator [Lachnospiraceae bacterium]|nr:response regulator [Lachnospiraceae bacterium]
MKKDIGWLYRGLFVLALIGVGIGIFMIHTQFQKLRRGDIEETEETSFNQYAEYPSDKRVLVICSYSTTYVIVPEEEDGIYDVLKNSAISYEVEYMNNKELGEVDTHEDTFYNSLKEHLEYHKNNGQEFSAILAADDDALHFCMDHRDELFPDLPIVFYGVNDIEYAEECVASHGVAGCIERTYLKENIELARKLLPNAKKIVMIHDSSKSGMGDWKQMQQVQADYPDMVISDINTGEVSEAEFIKEISSLENDTIAITGVCSGDNEGHFLTLDERANMIGEYASVPVFSLYMHGIGTGYTAGDAMYMRTCGQKAAEMVVEILNNGVSADDIELNKEGFHQVAYDKMMMDKFDLSTKLMPEDAKALNYTSVRQRYGALMLPMMIIIMSLILMMILFYLEYLRTLRYISREKAAEAAKEEKDRFLLNISHDIRTPMNAIVGYTEMAKKYVDDREKVIDCMDKVATSGEYMLNMLNDVLEIARFDSGKMEISSIPFDIRDVRNELFIMLEEMASKKSLDFTITNENIEHEYVYGDKLHLNQIVMNLLTNAIKYTKPGGKVAGVIEEIDSDSSEYGKYRITIQDNGMGMSKEFQRHIFDMFSREKNTTASGIQGTGLGMSIVKRLVDAMNGEIEIESEVGYGTTITVEMPLRLADSVYEDGVASNDAIDLSGMNVLLVEDNELNREIANEFLKEYGFNVETANDGAEAVDMVLKHKGGAYDFVLMDIQMPYMDGYVATMAIRGLTDKTKANVPIIAMTANAFEEDKQRAMLSGMNAHLAKPLNMDLLLEVVNNVLQNVEYKVDSVAFNKFKEKYTSLGCQCGYFIYSADEMGRIMYADDQVVDIYGCDDREQFKKLTRGVFDGMVYEDDLYDVSQTIIKRYENGCGSNKMTYAIRNKDGRIKIVNEIRSKVFIDSEMVYYCYIADVTNRKGLE